MEKNLVVVISMVSFLVHIKAQPPFQLHVVTINENPRGVVEDRGYMSQDFDPEYMLDLNYGRGWADHSYRQQRLNRRRRGILDKGGGSDMTRTGAPKRAFKDQAGLSPLARDRNIVYRSNNIIIKKMANVAERKGFGRETSRSLMKVGQSPKTNMAGIPHYIVYRSAIKALQLYRDSNHSKDMVTTEGSAETSISTTTSSPGHIRDNMPISHVVNITLDKQNRSTKTVLNTNTNAKTYSGGKGTLAEKYKHKLKDKKRQSKVKLSYKSDKLRSLKKNSLQVNYFHRQTKKNKISTDTETKGKIKMQRTKRSVSGQDLTRKRIRREFSAKEFAKRARAYGRPQKGKYEEDDGHYDSPNYPQYRRRSRNKSRKEKILHKESSGKDNYSRKREYGGGKETPSEREKFDPPKREKYHSPPERRKYVGPLMREKYHGRPDRRKYGGPPDMGRYGNSFEGGPYDGPREREDYGRSYRPGPGRYDYDDDRRPPEPDSELDRYEYEPEDSPQHFRPRPPHGKPGPKKRRPKHRDYGRGPDRGPDHGPDRGPDRGPEYGPRRREYSDPGPQDYDYQDGPLPPPRPYPSAPPYRKSHRRDRDRDRDMYDSLEKSFFEDRGGFKGFGSFYKYGEDAGRPLSRHDIQPSVSYQDEEDTYGPSDYDVPDTPPPPPPPPPPRRRHRKYHEPEPLDYEDDGYREQRPYNRRPPAPRPRRHHERKPHGRPPRPYRPRRRSGYRGPGPTYRVIDDEGHEEVMSPYAREADIFKDFDLDDIWSMDSFNKPLTLENDEDEKSFFSTPLFLGDSEKAKKYAEGTLRPTTPEPLRPGDDNGEHIAREAKRRGKVPRRFRRMKQLPRDMNELHRRDDYQPGPMESVDYPPQHSELPPESMDYSPEHPELPRESVDYPREDMGVPPEPIDYPHEQMGSPHDHRGLLNEPLPLGNNPSVMPHEAIDYPTRFPPEPLGIPPHRMLPPTPPAHEDAELEEETASKVVAAPRTFDRSKGICGEASRMSGKP